MGIPKYGPKAALQDFGISHGAIPEHKAQRNRAGNHSNIDPDDHGPVKNRKVEGDQRFILATSDKELFILHKITIVFAN